MIILNSEYTYPSSLCMPRYMYNGKPEGICMIFSFFNVPTRTHLLLRVLQAKGVLVWVCEF